MNVEYDPDFLKRLKKLDVRIRNSFIEKILLFSKSPKNPILNNHRLKDQWSGYRSIDITSDWRAIYKKIGEHKETVAYFVAIGTHKQLYKITRKSR